MLVRTTRFAQTLTLDGDHVDRPARRRRRSVVEPGRSASIVARLQPGNYLLIDNLPWHYWRGDVGGSCRSLTRGYHGLRDRHDDLRPCVAVTHPAHRLGDLSELVAALDYGLYPARLEQVTQGREILAVRLRNGEHRSTSSASRSGRSPTRRSPFESGVAAKLMQTIPWDDYAHLTEHRDQHMEDGPHREIGAFGVGLNLILAGLRNDTQRLPLQT